jgi:hypothetical protein
MAIEGIGGLFHFFFFPAAMPISKNPVFWRPQYTTGDKLNQGRVKWLKFNSCYPELKHLARRAARRGRERWVVLWESGLLCDLAHTSEGCDSGVAN